MEHNYYWLWLQIQGIKLNFEVTTAVWEKPKSDA